MKISSRGRYALRMMIDIALHSNGEWVSLKDVSERQCISIKYLEQIVSHLTRSNLLISSRGPHGGYMLAKPAEAYTVGDILRAIEGNLAPIACLETQENTCERQGVCPTLPFWQGLHEVINRYVDSVTLQDLARTPAIDQGDNYVI